MRAGPARDVAAAWVGERRTLDPLVVGAFIAGSVAELDDDADVPAYSDVDVVLVMAGEAGPKIGKFESGGVLLEVTPMPRAWFADAASVASNYQLAPSFRRNGILFDSDGLLGAVQSAVGPRFDDPEQLCARVADVDSKLAAKLAEPRSGSWAERVMNWVFPASMSTHMALVAAGRNPTVRRRYLSARDVLREHGRVDVYEDLLFLIGARDVEAHVVATHLTAMTSLFDRAVAIEHAPFPFSTDITAAARPIAVDAARELMEQRDHREAIFWIMATFARAQLIVETTGDREDGSFRAAAADLLGVREDADLDVGAARVRSFVSELRRVAEQIIDASKAI